MTLHPQEMKGFSFQKCLSDDDDQSSIGSKTHKHKKSRVSTSICKSSIKGKHSFKSSSSAASSSVKSLKMKKIQLEFDWNRKGKSIPWTKACWWAIRWRAKNFNETTRRTTKEFAATTRREQKILQQRWVQESQERRGRIETEDARLQAELSETIATIKEGKPETMANSDSKLISIARTRVITLLKTKLFFVMLNSQGIC